MKVELINGKYSVVLDDGDTVSVRIADSDGRGVQLTNQNDLINFSGNGDIVGTISGSSFMDKIEFEKLCRLEK